MQVTTDGLKDLREYTRVEEKSRPQVEAEAVAADRGGPAAHGGRPFEDRDLKPDRASSMAAASPPGPAPMMSTRFDIELPLRGIRCRNNNDQNVLL